MFTYLNKCSVDDRMASSREAYCMLPGNSMSVFSSRSMLAEFMAAVGIRADSSPDKPSLLCTFGFVVVVSPSTCMHFASSNQ
jgi:hypothetical protein